MNNKVNELNTAFYDNPGFESFDEFISIRAGNKYQLHVEIYHFRTDITQ